MNAVAIDTSTENLGIAISGSNGKSVSLSLVAGYRHGELLSPWIERLLAQAEIQARALGLVVCASGPGSFTGLRIGIATAKGLSLGAGCPLALVPSLDAIAFGHSPFHGLVIPVIDAKKKRYYAALYRNGKRVSDYLDIRVEDFSGIIGDEKTVLLCGPAARIVHESLTRLSTKCVIAVDPGFAYCNPYLLLALGIRSYEENPKGSADTEGPLYLRQSEAELGIQVKK